MTTPYGPENPDQPWPPVPPPSPGQGWPPAPPQQGQPPYPPPPPYPQQPMSAPPPPSDPWPTEPMSGPPQPGQPYPGQPYSGQPYPGQPYPGQPYPGQPMSAPPQPWQTQPMSGVPMSSAPGWPSVPPPPPPKKSGGKVLGIVLGITIPLIAICAVLGIVVVPKVLSTLPEVTGSTSPTPDIRAVPAVGTCYLGVDGQDQFKDDAETDELVPCTEEHDFETVGSGKIDDTERPTAISDAAHDLFARCETAASDFLGTSYRATFTLLELSVPSASAWDDGANWYRCDLTPIASMWDTSGQRATGSLKGTAKPITCLIWDVSADASGIDNVDASDCDVVHNGELAAVAPMPSNVDRNDHDALLDALSDLCYPRVTDFLGETDLRDELDFWINHPGTDTDGLDQNVLCMVSARDLTQQFTASLKGVGSGPIPFA